MATNNRTGNGAALGFEQILWATADKLRGHLDSAEYKHVVLGLIFLKYISDAFQELYDDLAARQETEYTDPEDRDESPSVTEFRPTHRTEMLLTFKDLEGNLACALDKWLSAEFGVQQAKHLFFGFTDDAVLNLEDRFVNLVNALEAFHRATSDGLYISPSKYVEVRCLLSADG